MKIIFVVVEDKAFLIQRLNTALAVRDAGHDVLVVSHRSERSKDIEELGFKYIDSGTDRTSMNPLKEVLSIYKLFKIYRKYKPDLVYHVSIKPVLYGSIAARAAGVRKIVNLINGLGYVFTEGGLKKDFLRAFIVKFYRMALRSKKVKVIFQNPDDRNLFIENKILRPEQAEVILGSGVDTERFDFEEMPNEKVKILFVARMLWDKGIRFLIEAIRLLKQDGLEFEMLFAGEPDVLNPRSVPLKQLKEWEREGLIKYLGFQDDMPRLMRESHIVCLPTYYREGVPLSLIESASVGRAIVTTDMPGCREIVRDGVNGFIVPPKSSYELYKALKGVITNNELRESMGRESRKLVEESFSKEVVNRETLKVYNSFDA
jgi:glycosyltransferase involved in cell wall biosynthesis